jgi:hypothetical protein
MENFKYILDNSSKKFVCPNCQKRRFVKYIDTATGMYLNVNFGRCDRSGNCGYHKAPKKATVGYSIKFLSIEDISPKAKKAINENGNILIIPKSQILDKDNKNLWLTEWYLNKESINLSGYKSKSFSNDEIVNITIPKQIEPKKPTYHNLQLLDKMFVDEDIEDNFIKHLLKRFDAELVDKAKEDYLITGTHLKWNNSTIFWQIDENENIRAGKVMLYNSETGKRIKEPYNHINWLHSILKKDGFIIDQCLFGMHLINGDYLKSIAIVESEKTAVIMSIILPEYIWLATGAKHNLKLDKLKPLKNRSIVLYPDKGEFENWQKESYKANKNGFNVKMSDLIEKSKLDTGSDLVDLYESKIV